jgi:hypothetical protein
MTHKVREITIRLVVNDDGPAMDSFAEAIQELFPDDLAGVETVKEETRDATGEECDQMGWDAPCRSCGKDADEFVDGDCPDCNPPIAQGGE